MIFNRFAREARRCVEAALQEARELGHDSVGDEDLLLGILRVGDGVAAEALVSLGVTLEAAREQSEENFAGALASIGISLQDVRQEAGETFDMSISAGRRIPFSPRAKKALERSLREARRLGDNRLTSEHILLAILRDEDGEAVRILSGLGVETTVVEDRLDELRDRSPSPQDR